MICHPMLMSSYLVVEAAVLSHILLILLVAVAFAAALTPIVLSVHLNRRYEVFARDLAESVAYGQDHQSTFALGRGLDRPVTTEQSGVMLFYVLRAGVGQPKRHAPDEEGVLVTFGDGSSLWMCPTAITRHNRLSDVGTYFRYTGSDGRVYAYVEPVLVFNGGEAFTSQPYDVETDEIADDTIGKPASGGGVRLLEDDIAWMSENMLIDTMVVVY